MNNYVVEINNLSKTYRGFNAVNNINLNIREGRIYGFLGPNGAGKSTTIRMILGLIKNSSGSIKIFGKNLKENRAEILKNVGALVESPSYYGHLNAYENLKIWSYIKGVDKNAIDEVLKLVNLYEHRKKKVSKFSLGMKQRLGIAQALIGNPELIILDEPTNGLDPMGIKEIRNLIVNLAKKHNKTIIISSHILSEMELMIDDVGIINKGTLLYEGSLSNLKSKYKPDARLEDIFIDLIGGRQ
ncbi:ABC-2 type transport system ATP-binding protein [Clostridium acetobutylicum]|uniref:ABC transporter, ATP-binding protein n=1 Tax=Clostridium acetobutylicum (strain ATCC 824 / DSM 792 / JCM 1419 / IAM 19013 / LMG 5710 / NBRC 13948 / NRRL B-527 / VKM B-1787 / 2291 / W) TaxID=272562 RepID=Q97MB0_CLOAB|nr:MULTISPECIES: ABC transporter ATP-binding protein [Clostridium]AAK78269.1 ABC transporter, ATP-binding protein [Clostridium acetobutylicum ATCC 824]ADZ19336.1 ABC transporter, ATP-binding protein [Clostridium acetobutylicum EA 2018]AEI34388.1 ABC transporter, ATP-binding protein [Clostridium acetobutylicum DSM 1731]AWV82119.1 ABC transporter ATP-binding protein [Clostridium acetobutylicum]AWV82168.1 ABC transporter ATP-binding protein [Clostridium acetobutylicum]